MRLFCCYATPKNTKYQKQTYKYVFGVFVTKKLYGLDRVVCVI
jgi:hypothetical protein